jgi:hypothetical protein
VVLFVPDARTLAAWGWSRQGITFLEGRTAADFATTTTDEAGRFEFDVRCVRAAAGAVSFAGQPSTSCIVVSAPGFALYGHEVRDLRSRHDDVGTLRLQHGGSAVGRVVDERGLGLAGARVSVAIADGWPRGTSLPEDIESLLNRTTSAVDGRFELENLPATRLQAEVAVDGRRPGQSAPFDIAAGRRHELPDLVLEAGGSVRGRVVDAAGRPVMGAEVVSLRVSLTERDNDHLERRLRLPASSRRGELQALTDEEGRFVLHGLARNATSLRARARGFAATLAHDILDGSDVVLQLHEAAVLDVRVIDRLTRAPLAASLVASVPILTFGEHVEPLVVEPSPDEPGRFHVIDPGAHGTDLDVSAPGHASTVIQAPGLAPGARDEFTIEMEPGFSLRGRVVDVSGQSIPGATVTLVTRHADDHVLAALHQLGYLDSAGRIRSAQVTSIRRVVRPAQECDEQGHFTFEQLAAGHYVVEARAAGYVFTASESLEARAEQPATECVLVLPRAGDVRGLVLDGQGRALPRFEVELLSSATDASHWAACDTAGRFFFRDVLPGTWSAVTRGHGEASVEVVAGEIAEVTVQLPAVAVLEIVVKAGSQPVAGLAVTGSTSGMPLLMERTDDQGACSFALPACKLNISIDTPGGGVIWRQVELLAGESRRSVIELPLGAVSVYVQDATSSQPAEGVPIAAVLLGADGSRARLDVWEDPLARAAVETSADGRARIEYLEPGTWEIFAGGRGWLPTEPVRVQVDADVADAALDVLRSPVIRGRVLHANGQPAPLRTRVGFVRLHPPEPPAASEAVVYTDEEGEFRCDTLEAAGTWVVVVPRSSYFVSLQPDDVLAQATTQVAEGQSAEVFLTLAEMP